MIQKIPFLNSEVLIKDLFRTNSSFLQLTDFFKQFKTHPFDMYVDSVENQFKLCIELPVLDANKEDITIETDSFTVSVRYRSKHDNDLKGYLWRGITRKSFELAWTIPTKYDIESIEATFKNGILKLEFSESKSKEDSSRKKITIK